MVAGSLRRTSGPPACEVGGHDDSHFGADAQIAPAGRNFRLFIYPIHNPHSAL